jgi:predicted lysophospholipase L1 biosynthesis ABC-type transport system permease subunit
MAGAIQDVQRSLAAAPDGERERLRRRYERTAHPCGCKSGAAMSLAAVVAWPAWILATSPPDSVLGAVLAVPLYLAVVIGAGAAGKLAGMAVGHRRHRRLGRRLARLATSRAAAPTSAPAEG